MMTEPQSHDWTPTPEGEAALGPWIMTRAGLAFPLLQPDPAKVRARDIAGALSNTTRFNGHVVNFYSVAQHCVLVANSLPVTADGRLKLYGLLHDAHEAYIGDIASPVKRALEQAAGTPFLKSVADRLDAAIHAAFGLEWPAPPDIAAKVKAADAAALATERRDLMPRAAPGQPDWDLPLPEPWPEPITPWAPSQAEAIFARSLDTMLSRCLGRRQQAPAVGNLGPRLAGE